MMLTYTLDGKPLVEPICRNCKHWKRGTWFHSLEWEPQGLWTCHKEGQEIGECRLANVTAKASADAMAVAVSYAEGIYGELITDASFGCNRFDAFADKSEQEGRIEMT